MASWFVIEGMTKMSQITLSSMTLRPHQNYTTQLPVNKSTS